MQEQPIYVSPTEARTLRKVLMAVIGAEEPTLSPEQWQQIMDLADRLPRK